MRKSLATTLLGALIGATLTGGAIAVATTGTAGAKACVNHHHVLGLISHGKCKSGFTKTTIGARGPRGLRGIRGKTGPQGPGANSESFTLAPGASKNFPIYQGVSTTASCGASDVEIHLNAPVGAANYTILGTGESDGANGVTDVTNLVTQTFSGNNSAGLDYTMRAGSGPVIRLTIAGLRTGSGCTYMFIELPTTAVG